MKHRLALAAPLFVLASLVLAPPLFAADSLVAEGATWKYWDLGTNLGTAWRAPAFNDAGWATGPAELGYGDGDEATVVGFGGVSSNKHITTYFRHAFEVGDPGQYLALELELLRDDGAVVYLNGQEVARSNMPGGAISWQTLAASTISGTEEDIWLRYPVAASLLVAGTNVLAVEVHQRSSSSSDLSFNLSLEGQTEIELLRGPYLQNATEEGITVRWRTNAPQDSRLRWGSAPDQLDQLLDDPALTSEHALSLSGLQAETQYYYSVGSSTQVLAGGDAQHSFRTHPEPGSPRPTRIWVIGDSGTADQNAAAVRDAYLAYAAGEPTDVWLMLGDNAYNSGTDAEYQGAVFDMYPQLLPNTTLFPTRGNHEDFSGVYYGIFDMPSQGQSGGLASGSEAYYSFDYANVHFVCLDSEGSNRNVGGPMYTWVDNDLASTDQDWIVAFWHHPPYTKGSHDSDTESTLIQMRQNFLPLLESHGVNLVLCGHSHSYERSYLIDAHYGGSASFGPQHLVDGGDGDPAGDGAYQVEAAANGGAVYAVAGSSGKLSSGPLNHPAMHVSTLTLGSMVIDVDAGGMDVRFLSAAGLVQDRFRILAWSDEALSADSSTLSLASGGTQQFQLRAGPAFAGELYLLLGSASGTSPGLPLGGGLLPLNPGPYFSLTLNNPNAAPLAQSFAVLDGAGEAQASFSLPPASSPALAGLSVHHAYAVIAVAPGSPPAFPLTSNPVPLFFE